MNHFDKWLKSQHIESVYRGDGTPCTDVLEAHTKEAYKAGMLRAAEIIVQDVNETGRDDQESILFVIQREAESIK